jgi:hypothetical protein
LWLWGGLWRGLEGLRANRTLEEGIESIGGGLEHSLAGIDLLGFACVGQLTYPHEDVLMHCPGRGRLWRGRSEGVEDITIWHPTDSFRVGPEYGVVGAGIDASNWDEHKGRGSDSQWSVWPGGIQKSLLEVT